MKIGGVRPSILFQLIGIIAVFSSGCGLKLTATPSACKTGVAQMSVLDTGIRRDCGCSEGDNVTFSGTAFQCTVARGTVVYIYYPGVTQAHQIVFSSGGVTGTPQNHDPNTHPETNPVDAVTMQSTSAGITFTDSYTGNGGTFIVQ